MKLSLEQNIEILKASIIVCLGPVNAPLLVAQSRSFFFWKAGVFGHTIWFPLSIGNVKLKLAGVVDGSCCPALLFALLWSVQREIADRIASRWGRLSASWLANAAELAGPAGRPAMRRRDACCSPCCNCKSTVCLLGLAAGRAGQGPPCLFLFRGETSQCSFRM